MEISATQRRQLKRIAREYHLDLILLFGSMATGIGEHPRSDLDIAMRYRGEAMGLGKYGELQHALQELFPGKEIDLSLINSADPLLLKKMMETGQLLYGDLRQFSELKLYAYKRFQDHRRFFEMERTYAEWFLKTAARPS